MKQHRRNGSLASLLLAILASLAACSESSNRNREERSRDPAQIVRPDPKGLKSGDYIRAELKNEFGKVERYTIKPEVFAQRKGELETQTLRPLKSGASFSTRAYALDGYERPGTVVLEPSVILRSGDPDGKIRVREMSNGLVSIDLAIALVDGLSTEVTTGRGAVPLPPEFQIKDRETFLGALGAELNAPPGFLASVRCPEAVKLMTKDGAEFAVALRIPLKACPLNSFLPATLRLQRNEWAAIAVSLAEEGAVTLESRFNLKAPLVIVFSRFDIKKALLVQKTRSRLKDISGAVAKASVEKALSEVLNEMESGFRVDAPQELFAEFKDRFLAEYFSPSVHCPDGMEECVERGGDWSEQQAGDYSFQVRREEFFGTPLELKTVSKVSDSLGEKQEILISAKTENPLEPPKTSELSQVFRTVNEGEVAELKFREIGVGEVTLGQPKIERIPNRVCVDPYTLCQDGNWRCTNPNSENFNCRNECTGGWRNVCVRSERRCAYRECSHPCLRADKGAEFEPQIRCPFLRDSDMALMGCGCVAWDDVCVESQNQCQGWSSVCDTRRMCDRLPAPARPALPYRTDRVSPAAVDFSWQCSRLAQKQCDPDKWEDQWQRVTTWSLPSASQRIEHELFNPKYWENVIAGLSVRFSWAGKDGTASVVCRLRDLEHKVLGQERVLIVLKNTEWCTPFGDENRKPGFGPTISFMNQIAIPLQFQCGSLWENWRGERSYTCRLPDGSSTELKSSVSEDEQRIARGEKSGIFKPYYPPVELQGQLRIVGSRLESIGGSK